MLLFSIFAVPEKPTQLELSPISHNQMEASWNPPAQGNGIVRYYSVLYRRSTNSTQNKSVEGWTEKQVANTYTLIDVDCYKTDEKDGVWFDVQVSAVNMATDGRVLKGPAAVWSEYHMCQLQISGMCI